MHSLSLLLYLLICSTLCCSINHWVLKDNKIIQKVDSPFHMREPENLIAFLEQVRLNGIVENSYVELLRKREDISDHLRFSMQFGENLLEQAKCAIENYLLEKKMSYLKITPDYMKRLELPAHMESDEADTIEDIEPICSNFYEKKKANSMFDHLDSFKPSILKIAHINSEEDPNSSSSTEQVRRLLVQGLKTTPNSWKFHTLGSYYWRLRGDVSKALDCAHIGLALAPTTHKDIPMLSLGTILFRMNSLADADVVLSAVVKTAPNIAENHVVLAIALAMKHDFERSLYHFDEAEHLDPSILPRTQQVRTFITCLQNLNKKTSKMYSYVEYMKNEVKDFKKLKKQITQDHEKLMQQQLPLNTRYQDTKSIYDDLHKRGQYCSTRTSSSSGEPTLFCDFYSDMQMRLESKDTDIEMLERELKSKTEAVIRQVSQEIHNQMNSDQLRAAKAQAQLVVPTKPESNLNQ